METPPSYLAQLDWQAHETMVYLFQEGTFSSVLKSQQDLHLASFKERSKLVKFTQGKVSDCLYFPSIINPYYVYLSILFHRIFLCLIVPQRFNVAFALALAEIEEQEYARRSMHKIRDEYAERGHLLSKYSPINIPNIPSQLRLV